MAKKTAAQRLAELELLQAQLKKQERAEDKRKDSKVGQFVREMMPHIEHSAEFQAWLKTDIDRALFGVTLQCDDVTQPSGPVTSQVTNVTPKVADYKERFAQAAQIQTQKNAESMAAMRASSINKKATATGNTAGSLLANKFADL